MKPISCTHPHSLRKGTVDQEEGIYKRIQNSGSLLLTPEAYAECCPKKADCQKVDMNPNTPQCSSHFSEAQFPLLQSQCAYQVVIFVYIMRGKRCLWHTWTHSWKTTVIIIIFIIDESDLLSLSPVFPLVLGSGARQHLLFSHSVVSGSL